MSHFHSLCEILFFVLLAAAPFSFCGIVLFLQGEVGRISRQNDVAYHKKKVDRCKLTGNMLGRAYIGSPVVWMDISVAFPSP